MKIEKESNIGILGVSPFNSYFSTEKIHEIIENIKHQHNKIKVFFPGDLTFHTLLAKGYTPEKAKKSLSKQNRYCVNKIKKALNLSGFSSFEIENILIQPHDFAHNEIYRKFIAKYQKLYQTNKVIKTQFQEIISPLLENEEINSQKLDLAANYIIGELPFILNYASLTSSSMTSFYYPNFPKAFHKMAKLGSTQLIDYEHQQRELQCINF